jgi:hypothetical protein
MAEAMPLRVLRIFQLALKTCRIGAGCGCPEDPPFQYGIEEGVWDVGAGAYTEAIPFVAVGNEVAARAVFPRAGTS